MQGRVSEQLNWIQEGRAEAPGCLGRGLASLEDQAGVGNWTDQAAGEFADLPMVSNVTWAPLSAGAHSPAGGLMARGHSRRDVNPPSVLASLLLPQRSTLQA